MQEASIIYVTVNRNIYVRVLVGELGVMYDPSRAVQFDEAIS